MRETQVGLRLVGVKVEMETYEALVRFAQSVGLAPGSAARKILAEALAEGDVGKRVKRDLFSEGYRDGLRQAQHDVQLALSKLFPKE